MGEANGNILVHFIDVLFNMAWQIYWPLAFGLMLSAFIRNLVPMDSVVKHLGKTNARSLSFTTLLGVLSSSCSYAAASMSHTLIVKKSTLANAMAFLVSSTNLILEMFIVLVALLGWTFFWGEVIGGLILIMVVAFLFERFYPKHVEETLRKKLDNEQKPQAAATSDCGMDMSGGSEHEHMHMHMKQGSHDHKQMDMDMSKDTSNQEKVRKAARFFHMDLGMIGKEILIGVVVSSLLITIVPMDGWRTLFISNDANLPDFLHSLIDVVIGVFVAMIAYVCSVGNLLLAAALWHGGISFGGVIGFILADVLTIPMMRVYQKYYGNEPTKWMVGLLFVAIIFTGLSIDALFTLFGVSVSSETLRPLIQDGVGMNFTTVMNLIFIPLSIWFYRVGKKANAGMGMSM